MVKLRLKLNFQHNETRKDHQHNRNSAQLKSWMSTLTDTHLHMHTLKIYNQINKSQGVDSQSAEAELQSALWREPWVLTATHREKKSSDDFTGNRLSVLISPFFPAFSPGFGVIIFVLYLVFPTP